MQEVHVEPDLDRHPRGSRGREPRPVEQGLARQVPGGEQVTAAPAGLKRGRGQPGGKGRRIGRRVDQHQTAAACPEVPGEVRGPARAAVDAGDIDLPEPKGCHRAGHALDTAVRRAGRSGGGKAVAGGIDGDDPALLRQMGGDGAEPLRGSRQIGDEQQRPHAVAAPLADHERCAVHLDEAARARLLRRRRCRRQPGGAGAQSRRSRSAAPHLSAGGSARCPGGNEGGRGGGRGRRSRSPCSGRARARPLRPRRRRSGTPPHRRRGNRRRPAGGPWRSGSVSRAGACRWRALTRAPGGSRGRS